MKPYLARAPVVTKVLVAALTHVAFPSLVWWLCFLGTLSI